MAKVFDKYMKCGCRENVVNDLISKMPNATSFEDLPSFTFNNSAPTGGATLAGGARLAKQNSKGGAAQAQAAKKKAMKQRANQLVNVLNTFMGI